jgi:hypothetical protein
MPLIVPELEWMLTGERMSRGFVLYTQTWSDISPLSAFFYWILDISFGRSQLAYQLTALLLIILQAVWFNYSLKKNQIYPEKSNLPMLLYILCMGLFFDFFTLSPMLMGVTFLLLAIDGTFKHISEDADNDEVFSIGFYIGVATLFYVPLGIFLAYLLLSFVMLAATRIREYFLMIFGFAFSISLAALFFFMIDGLDEFYFNWLAHLLDLKKIYYVPYGHFLLIATPLLALLLISALQMFGGDVRFIHYQIRCQQSIFIWLVCAGVCLAFVSHIAPYQLILLVPGVVFYGTHFFLLAKKWWMADVALVLLFCAIVFINFSNLYPVFTKNAWINLENLVLTPAKNESNIEGKKIFVAGENVSPYLYNLPATPYLKWQLAERHFDDLDDYITITEVYENFIKDLPDVIIDQEGKIAILFNRVPALARYYTKTDTSTYIRRKPAVTRR